MRFSSCIGRSKTEWKSTVERLFPYEDTFVVQNSRTSNQNPNYQS